METKELTLKEKYDQLFDEHMLNLVTFYSLHKEMGIVDKGVDWSLKIRRKMLPGGLGKSAFKLLKAVSPSKALNQLLKQYMGIFQTTISLSDIELNRISDREVTVRVKHCPELVRMKEIIEKTDLDLSPRFMCENRCKGVTLEAAKEFGIDGTSEFEEKGCMWKLKLN